MLRMLDVVIGVVLLFALLSVVCSAATEIVEALLRRRAADLEDGIKRLLGGDAALVTRFYDHPLVKVLTKARPVTNGAAAARPSYIPTRTAALALVEVLSPAKVDRSSLAAMAQGLSDQAPGGKALRSLLASVTGDVQSGVSAVERWFDDAMNGVSSAYKRRTQRFLFIFGGLVVLALNADAVNVVTALAADPAMRLAAVEVAVKTTKGQTPIAPVSPEVSARVVPTTKDPEKPATPLPVPGGAAEPLPTPPSSSQSPSPSPSVLASAGLEALSAATLPVGWVPKSMSEDRRGYPVDPLGFLTKVGGLLITTLAVSLGAPFWFDLLSRLVQIRASVKPEDAQKRRAHA